MGEEQQRRSSTYIEGNTVRKLNTAPYRPERPSEPERRERTRTQQPQRRRAKEQQQRQRASRKNMERARRWSLSYTLFLGAAVICILATCTVYLNLQSQAMQLSSQVTTLKSELNTLADANLAAAERISNAVSLEEVYEYATRELGMSYPKRSQIIYFSSSDNDYVKQYQSIPK